MTVVGPKTLAPSAGAVMPVVGLAVSGITGALFASPGVPVIAGFADQLVAIALSAVGVDSSSDGPPPAAAVGHGAVGA